MRAKTSYNTAMNKGGAGSGKNQHRMRRERETIAAMINIYCRAHHGVIGNGLCGHCAAILEYATLRLDRCPFQENKTTCARCAVHCYKTGMREEIRIVMRYAGPRMVHQHPLLALFHFLDGFRKKPRQPRTPAARL